MEALSVILLLESVSFRIWGIRVEEEEEEEMPKFV